MGSYYNSDAIIILYSQLLIGTGHDYGGTSGTPPSSTMGFNQYAKDYNHDLHRSLSLLFEEPTRFC